MRNMGAVYPVLDRDMSVHFVGEKSRSNFAARNRGSSQRLDVFGFTSLPSRWCLPWQGLRAARMRILRCLRGYRSRPRLPRVVEVSITAHARHGLGSFAYDD